MNNVLPTVADVVDAHVRLRGWLVETPLLESAAINARVGARVLFKAECLQHSGSFKIRGALNCLLQLSADERRAGVVAFSSGNHAQAVALAAQWLAMPATIVMPADAPKVKLERTRAYGAEVVLYDREREDREAIASNLAEQRGAALVPPFDHPHIIAGQGTLAFELGRAARGRQLDVEALYVPCSGGGLVAGCALAIKAEWPACAVYAVEPRGFEDTAASLAADARRGVLPGGTTLCDGLRAPLPGAITFAINRRELTGARAVDDEQIRAAMAVAAQHLKVVVEPSGAAALAAVLAEPRPLGACVAVVLSGGNVDADLFADVLRTHGGNDGVQ
jgi:threonine dehydratase